MMSNRASQASSRRRQQRHASRRRLKIIVFGSGALLVLGLALYLVVSPFQSVRAPAAVGESHQLVITMAGFTPPGLRVPAGRPFTIRLVNPDSSYHTDGGGWHQFRIERLGIDVRIPPRSESAQGFDGLGPGTYEFYCDICCGGKENPSMRGVIEVTG